MIHDLDQIQPHNDSELAHIVSSLYTWLNLRSANKRSKSNLSLSLSPHAAHGEPHSYCRAAETTTCSSESAFSALVDAVPTMWSGVSYIKELHGARRRSKV